MKKSYLSKILAVVFFVLLFAVVLTVSVGAEEHTIPAGDAAALQSAVASAAAGDTITLSGGEYALTGSLSVTKSMTIQGSGTVALNNTILNVSGTGTELTLGGSVIYQNKGDTGRGISVNSPDITITIKDSVKFDVWANAIQDSANSTGTTTVNVISGTLTSRGGNCAHFGIGKGNVVLTIGNGTFNGTANICFNFAANVNNVKITVENGTFNAKQHCFNMEGCTGTAEVTLKGGTFTTTGNHIVNAKQIKKTFTMSVSGGTCKANNMGFVLNELVDGSAATISGGTFEANGHVFHVANTKSGSNVTVNVSGGTMKPKVHCFNFEAYAGTARLNIMGGTFQPGNSLVVAKGALHATMTGGTVTSCATGFNMIGASAATIGETGMHGVVEVSGNASINATTAFSSTSGKKVSVAFTGGAGLVSAKTPFNVDSSSTLNKTINGASYVNGANTVYTSLGTALANVAANGTVTIYGDHVGSFELKKGVTINGSGSVTAEWTVFNVRAAAAGSTINLEGSVRYVSQKGVGFSVQGSGITFNLRGDISFTTKGNVMQDAGSLGAGAAMTVNVEGGTYRSEDNCFRFGISDTNGRAFTTVDMTVSGGTFEAKNAFVCISGAAVDMTMTGGQVTTCLNGFNAYNKAEGTPALDSGDNVKIAISGSAAINATQFVLSSTAGYKASINVKPEAGYVQAPKLYNKDGASVLADTVTEPYVQYVGEGRVGFGYLRAAATNAAPGSTLTVYGTNTLADGALDITKSLTFTGEGTISTRYTTFNVKNSENIVLIVGGDLTCISREGVGVSVGAANAQITFKNNVTFHTKGSFIQDSAKVTGGTTTVNILGGTYYSESNGIYFKDSTGTAIINVMGGTITAKVNCICTHVAYAGSARVNIADGTLHALGENASYCVHLGDTANDANVACSIYGGTFLNDAGYAAVCSSSSTNDVADVQAPRVNIYGGYFVGNRSACVQAVTGGIVNIWGGYFHYLGARNVFGSPLIIGSGSASKGTANVYGGNFVSEASGPAFSCANAVSVFHLHGGYNAIGGGYLVNNKNTAAGTPSAGYPVGQQHYAASIYMTDGAGVRIADGTNGLRFVSVITAEALAYIRNVADGGDISYGTLIAPVDLVRKADAFTHEGMLRAGVKFVDVPAKDGLVARADGGFYIRAAIVNIREENIDREFAAVSYVRYTVNNREVIVYSVYREHKNARSIAQVARLALKEAELYTADQLAVLATYAPTTEAPVIDFYLIAGQSNAAGSTNFQQDFANSDPNFKNGYSNVYYSGLAMSGSGISSKMAHTCVPVRIGYGNNGTNFGPELGLADALSSYYNAESGKYAAVIKYAYSGICLRDDLAAPADAEGNWCPPSWLEANGALDEVKSGQHYRAFVRYIEECIADYEAMGFEVNIVAAYWMQGEQDVTWNGTAGLYDELLTCLVNDLRADVARITGDEKYLQLPFAIGELSSYLSELSSNPTHFANTAALIRAQHDVAAALSNVYVIDQSNLPSFDIEPGEKASNKDRYHWISHNMLWIGQNLGYTLLEEVLGVEVQHAETDIVAQVFVGDELIGSYTSLVGAISKAPAGATVKMTKDITMYSTLVIGNRNAITLDGCGHTLTFIVPTVVNTGSSEANENCGAFRLYATDLTVTGLTVSLNVSVAGVYRLFGAEVAFADCSFVQGGEAVDAFAEVVIACTFDVN